VPSTTIDLLTLREALAASSTRWAGRSTSAALIDGVPHSTNTEHYARIVEEKATLRRI
jgi:replicative DNA helicase